MNPAPEISGHVIPNVPFPPVGGSMDHTLQLVFLSVLWAICAGFFVMALRSYRKDGSPLPLLVLMGGALCMFIEPIVDVMGLCWFWPQGQFVLFEAFGRPIPNWILPTYIFYVGGQALYTAHRLEKGETMLGVFKLYAIYAVINVLLEEPPLHMGLYTYYGAQPLQPGLLPLWWAAPNAAMPITLGAMIVKLKPYLSGWKALLILPLMPMGDALTNGAVSWPVWTALNSSDDLMVTTAGALLTVGLGLVLMWVIALAVATDSPALAAVARSGVSSRLKPLLQNQPS